MIYEICALRPPFTADNQLALAMKIKSGKLENLPEQYSEGLQNTIKMMLNLEQDKRPSIEELIVLPQISIILRERKMKEHYTSIKRREEEVNKREEDIKTREEAIATKEKTLDIKASELEDKAKQLEVKAKELEELEQRLLHMRGKLQQSNKSFNFEGDVSSKSSSKNDIFTYETGKYSLLKIRYFYF